MKRRLLMAAAVATYATQPLFAQESTQEITTATALAVTETTASPGVQDAVTTGASRADGRRAKMAGMNFERRWERAEETYKAAGISEEKIQQLKALEKRIFDGMQSGERVDFASIREERNRILTTDEQAKLREARQKMMQDLRKNAGDGATTEAATSN